MNAANLLELLPNNRAPVTRVNPTGSLNDQQTALKNFLALYDLIRKDEGANDTGSWDLLPVKNGGANSDVVRSALFGDGSASGGLIDQVHIGSMQRDINGNLQLISGFNPYYSIRAVLDRLGVNNSPVPGHSNHFHVYVNPPEVKAIETTNNLLADPLSGGSSLQMAAENTINQVFDVSYSDDPLTGEATMFLSLLVSAVPPLVNEPVAPPVMVAAQATNTALKPDMTLSVCEPVQTPDNPNGQLGGGCRQRQRYKVIGMTNTMRYLPLKMLGLRCYKALRMAL